LDEVGVPPGAGSGKQHEFLLPIVRFQIKKT
jgi:hypothetical protein